MEQITLTKQELIEIVEREVNKKLDGAKSIAPLSIFSSVKIQEDEIAMINEKFKFTKFIKTPYRGRHYKPISLNKYSRGGRNEFVNGKVYNDHIHDHIRKLTLAVFGVSKNSDLSESEFEEAVGVYKFFKDMYLHLYEKRLSRLTIDDFE